MGNKAQTFEWQEYLRLREERPKAFAGSKELEIICDLAEVEAYEAKTGRTIGVVYKSPWRMMLVDLVKDCSGRIFAYERILPTVQSGAVVTVPVFEDKFILLKQYRHALRGYQWAFPRGFAESGISDEENAKKELSEELHAVTRSTCVLGKIISDSSLSGDMVSVIYGEIDSFETVLGHEEITESCAVTREELDKMIRNNEITDCFTLSAYTLFLNRSKQMSLPVFAAGREG